MKAPASIIEACSAKVKLMIGKKIRLFSSAHLALEIDANLLDNDCSISCVPVSDQDISSDLTNKDPVEFHDCNKLTECMSFGMNHVDQFVTMGGTFWRDNYRKDVEDNELKRIKLILEDHNWNIGSSRIGYETIDLDQRNVIKIMNVLWSESKDAALALYFFRWCEYRVGIKHTVKAVCTMINLLISGNMNYRAVDLIQSLVVKNNGQDWWLSLVSSVLRETNSDRKVLHTAYSILVSCYLKENMTSAALRLIGQLSQFDFFPSMGLCNLLLKALLQSGKTELAWAFFEEILGRGLGCNISIISLFIHKYCTDGDLKSGWRLLNEMKNYGVNPDIVAYTKFIDALSKMSCLREATSLLFKLPLTGVALDSVSVSSVIDGFCKIGKVEKAVYLLKIFNLPRNIFVFNSYISKLCSDGEMVTASMTFHEMLDIGFSPDCFCYTTMIQGYFKKEEIKAALSYLADMLKRGIKLTLTTHTVLLDGYCKLGDVVTAEQLFQKMEMEGWAPDIIAYNTLMNGYRKKGYLHKAFELLHKMKSAAICPDNVTHNTLIHSLVEQGFVVEAKELLDELIRRGFSPDVSTFTNLFSGFTRKGYIVEAYLVWLRMSEHNIKPDVVMCSALLSGYCRARRMAEANALFFEMVGMGLVPDLVLYNTLIYGHCSVANIESACYIIDMMVKSGISPNEVTHRVLAYGYENKWAQNPVETAKFKLQEIMMKYGIQKQLHIPGYS